MCARGVATPIWQEPEQHPAQKLLHCSDNGQISWYEFVVAIFKEAQYEGLLITLPDISACNSDEHQVCAPCPAYSALKHRPVLLAERASD